MKWKKAELLDSVVSVYDQTKTTIKGRVYSKSIGGATVLGPPLTKFIDVVSDSGQNPGQVYCTENGRIFTIGTILNGTTYDTLPIILYDFDFATGATTYRGQVLVQLPNLAATTSIVKGFKAIDTGTTGWKIFVLTTATVAINGGLFMVNNIDLTDFQIVAPITIPMATSSNAKAVYFLQDPANIGAGQLNIAGAGMVLDDVNSRMYVHNGIATVHQYYVYSTSASPTYVNASVSVSVSAPGKIAYTGHPFLTNGPVIFTGGTLPTGLTVGTVYFVRNPTANDFELSATSGGASITTTGSVSVGATIGRAWGTVGSNFIHKTGNLPVLTGTLLLNDSEDKAIPTSAPINGGILNGNLCAFFSTTTNLYLGLLSELTSGATTWASLTTSNILGAPNEITTPISTFAAWSDVLDACTYTTNASKFITKQVQNNVIRSNTGSLNNQYYEGFSFNSVDLGLVTVTGMDHAGGWLFTSGGTTGQRGIIASDFRSDSAYDYSYIVTKVISTPNSLLKFTTTWEKLADLTGNIKLQYRSSGFGSITGGWIDAPFFTDLSYLVLGSQVQFKILFNIQSEGSSSPAQISSLLIGIEENNSISDNWEFSDDWSDNTSPSRIAFRLREAYSTVVPTLYFRAYDLSDALLINNNTVTDIAKFEYSTNNGTSWTALGIIPNVVGTLIRYTFTTPPGVEIRPGIKES